MEHGCHIAQGRWSEEEAKKSSTWREIKAVRLVLESLTPKLKNERIRWFSDNQNVVKILQVGSKKGHLQQEALAIFSMAAKNLIRLEPEWIPRAENQQVDYLDRLQDRDDWRINPGVFCELDSSWGPHTVDRFADHHNTQLPRFNSRFWNPGTEVLDAFTCDWGSETNWICPPPYLIPRVIRHAQKTKAKGTLIVPLWRSALFWPMLFPCKDIPAKFVMKTIVLMRSEQLVLPDKSGCNLFKGLPNSDLLAILVNFTGQIANVC